MDYKALKNAIMHFQKQIGSSAHLSSAMMDFLMNSRLIMWSIETNRNWRAWSGREYYHVTMWSSNVGQV